MSSLSSCIKKAGPALAQADKDAILSRASELRDGGMGAQEAAIKAVDELMASVQAMIDAASAPKAAPSANTLVTEDAAEKARAIIRAKLRGNTLNSGIDPELLQAGITLAAYHVERGARKFAAYARAMVDDMGDSIKPYLQSWYMAMRNDPSYSTMRADMDKASAVEDLDVDEVLATTAAPDTAGEDTPADDGATTGPDTPAAPVKGDNQGEAGKRIRAAILAESEVKKTNANSAMVWQIIHGPSGEAIDGPPGVYPGNDGPLAGSATMGNRGWGTKREAQAALDELKRRAALADAATSAAQLQAKPPETDPLTAQAEQAPAERSAEPDKIEDVGEKIGGARKDTASSTGPARKRATDDTRPAWARRFEISQIVTPGGMLGEVKDAGRWIIRDGRSLDWMKQPKQVGRNTFATKEEAEAHVPLAAVSLKHRTVAARDGKYEIWRDINDRKRVKVVDRQFDSRDEAMAYMLANAVQIVETNTTFGEADIPLPPDRARAGPERRTGNVNGQDFKDTFGLRGVEFGNWNNQDERQALMNDAWDGLLDLADVLGLPPKALGLNGDLALAFGARGHGLNSARAHYEPARTVINLTKEQGAGSLAHEWFHALDHYFGRQDGKASAEWKVGEDGTRTLEVAGDGAEMASTGFRGERSGVRAELRAAYDAMLRTMTKKAESYVEDTAKADKFTGVAREELASALASLRRSLAEQLDVRYWKRNNKPASAEQLAEFDAIAKQMLDGEVSALATDWRNILKNGDQKASTRAALAVRWTNDSLERLSEIHKAVRGRSGFDGTNKQGVLDRLRGNMERYSQRLKMLADAQAGAGKVRAVPTDFAMNAREMDQGRGTDYWTTPHEMAARAFQGYVEDKIAERGGVSRFLNYAPENAAILTPWGFKRPYPHGEERKAINAALDKFISALETRADDAGNVAVFSRSESSALEALSENDELFALPKSAADTVEQIAADIDPAIKVSKRAAIGSVSHYDLTMPDGKVVRLMVRAPNRFGPDLYGYNLDANGEMVDQALDRPGVNPDDVPQDMEDVYIDASLLKSGGSGVKAYQIAATFAHNTGRVFIGDPAGLSDAALIRRSEQMLSSALKFGTTDHLAPHPDQVKGNSKLGVPALRWQYGDHLGNIERLIDVNLKGLENAGLDDTVISFDLAAGEFRDANGATISRADIGVLAAATDAGWIRGAGGRTLARAAVLRALLREARGEGAAGGRRDGVLARLARLGSDPGSPVGGLFYSRAEGAEPASDRRQAVEALVKQIASRWGNAPVVVVVDSMEDERVPKAVRDYEKAQQSKGASGAPEGFFFGGKVYLVAGQLGGDADVLRVLFHEFGHAGLRTLFGPQLSTILTRLAVLNASKVRSKAAQYGLDYDKPADRRAAAEEVLAEMAERNPTNGWVKQAVAAIRSFLRAHVPGFSKMRLSDAELVRTFVRPALDYVAGNPAMPVKTNRAQFLVDKGGADAKPFADGGIAEVLVEQGAQALNIDQRLEVMARVFGALQDLKVFEAVVGLDSVDVVNDIIDAKLTASGGRDNHAMLLERLAVKFNGPIADQVKVIDALFPAVQRAAKKLAPAEAGADGFFGVISAATTGAYKQLAADAAGKLNGRHVVTPTSDGLLGDGVASTASSPPSVSADVVEKDSAAFSRSIGDAVGSIADKFNKGPAIVGQTGRQYTPAQLAAMTNVGFQAEPQTIQERAKSLWAGAGKTLAQGLVDQFAPVKAISEKAYGLLRLSKGASGAFEALLQGGKLKISDGVYDFDATQRGGVVDTLFKPLNGEHHDFLRWVAANRADRLMGVGKENLFTPEDIASLKSLADGATDFDYTIQHGARAGQVTRERTAIYADSLKTFNAFSANVLDMAEQSGLIDGEARGLWENEFYVPFYRVEEDGNIAGANIKNGAVRQQAFRSLTGRKNKLNADLLDNTLMNWAHLLDAGAKNRAAKASIEAAEKMGAAELVGGPSGKGTVWFRENGEKRYSFVSDPHLLTAISALEYAGMRNPVMNAMGAFKRALTIGVTASPFFKIRNLIRDSVQAIGTGNLSYNIAANVAQGWKLTDPTGDSHFRLLAGGGTIHFGTMMEGNEAKRVQALVESGVDAAHILDSDHKVKAFYRKFIEPGITAYNELGNRGEEINRASLYDQLMKQGMSHAEASLQARDLMDFSMQGSFTSIRFLTQVVPFLNARIQGLYKLGRAAKEDPARFSAVLGAVTLMSLALLAAYSDDDDWKKREDWDRNNFWWFKIAGTAVRIPKPFEIGAIATLAERGFELAFDKEMTGARFRKQVLTLLGDNLSMNPIPQLVKPILDVYANKNSFTGRPIETMGMEKLKPAYRVTERTTMAAKGISAAANVVTGLVGAEAYSPVQVDSLLQGYFGWLGSFIVGGGDVVARIVSDQPAKATPDYWKAATGGIISSLQDAPSRYVSQMYEQASEVEKAYGTWQMLRKQGRTDEAAEFQAENKDDINRHRELSRVKQTETRLNARIRSIQMSDRPADEKRDLIRSIQSQKDQIARALAPAG